MEEVLFEGTHTRDKAFYSELANYLCFKTPSKIILNCLVTICLVWSIIVHTWTATCFFAFYFIILAVSYFNYKNVPYKRDLESNNGKEFEVNVSVTDTQIIHKLGDSTTIVIDISILKKVVTSKNYVIMVSKTNQMYIIDKRKFEKGTPDELVSFLKSKGVK